MKTKNVVKIFTVVITLLFFMSCASKKNPRKCNGKKGIRTNMGVM